MHYIFKNYAIFSYNFVGFIFGGNINEEDENLGSIQKILWKENVFHFFEFEFL